MKAKFACLLTVVVFVTILCGCQSSYITNFGFGSTFPGILYNDQTRGTFMLEKMQSMKDVEILGRVRGTSTCSNILLLVAVGDAGIEAAKKDALRSLPQADDIVNIEVDTSHSSLLGLVNRSTTTLRGIAIKYKK